MGLALATPLLTSGSAWAARAQAKSEATDADTSAKPKGKKATTRNKKKKGATAATPAALADTSAPRRRIGASPAYVVGDSDAHLINDAAPPIVPFPEDSKAVKKAFDETRRDQLIDAEKAARDVKSPDRWRTVLFALRGLPEHADPEACFWRVLSFYRLGELARARALREGCELPAKDSAALNGEDAIASGIPEIGTVAFDDGFGPPQGAAGSTGKTASPPQASLMTAAYVGPGPQHR